MLPKDLWYDEACYENWHKGHYSYISLAQIAVDPINPKGPKLFRLNSFSAKEASTTFVFKKEDLQRLQEHANDGFVLINEGLHFYPGPKSIKFVDLVTAIHDALPLYCNNLVQMLTTQFNAF
jgi:hypothetical protein